MKIEAIVAMKMIIIIMNFNVQSKSCYHDTRDEVKIDEFA